MRPMSGLDPMQERDPALAWLCGLFLLALLLRLACFTGIYASDDVAYSYYAQRIAEGSYVPVSHHFAIRYGFILPVGLIYAVVGISEWATIALPLVASSLSAVLLALIGTRLFSLQVGLAAGLLYATFPIELRHATILVPDGVAQCYILLAVLAHVRTEDRAPMALGALAGACIGIAYLTKEPAVFVAPALFLDAVLRRRWQHAFGIAVGVGAVIAVEHSYYWVATGDLLFRFRSVDSHNYVMSIPPSEWNVPLTYRLFKEYPALMLIPNVHYGVHSLAALVLSAAALWRFRSDRRVYFLVIWASLPWLYLNFGSSSLMQYLPIPTRPRYIIFAYPPLFLLAAWLLADLASKTAWATRAAVSLLAAVLVVGVVCGLSTRGKGLRAEKVAALRGIANRIEEQALGCVRFDIAPDQWPTWMPRGRWELTLHILSGGKVRECEDGSRGVVIGWDPVGHPYVASGRP
jgi:4-amino-4-deoxy-L-arabinose transferase-like glycosyltransferase